MPFYKTGKQKDGRAQYRVFVSYKDVRGEYRKKTKCVYGLTEAKTAALGGNDPYMYQTTSITLDAAADKIKLFAWSGLDKPAPAFSAISVK